MFSALIRSVHVIGLLSFVFIGTEAGPFDPYVPIRMGAELNKPYTEVEYNGIVYPLQNLRGGHNSPSPSPTSVVQACITHPPEYDPIAGIWRIPVDNNLIKFSGDVSPFGEIILQAVPDSVVGYLEITDPATFGQPSFPTMSLDFPVISVFTFQVELSLIDLGLNLFSSESVTITSDALTSWPPPVGTIYYQPDFIEMVLTPGGPTIATIRPDTTVITALVPVPEGGSSFCMLLGGLATLAFAMRLKESLNSVSPVLPGHTKSSECKAVPRQPALSLPWPSWGASADHLRALATQIPGAWSVGNSPRWDAVARSAF